MPDLSELQVGDKAIILLRGDKSKAYDYRLTEVVSVAADVVTVLLTIGFSYTCSYNYAGDNLNLDFIGSKLTTATDANLVLIAKSNAATKLSATANLLAAENTKLSAVEMLAMAAHIEGAYHEQ